MKTVTATIMILLFCLTAYSGKPGKHIRVYKTPQQIQLERQLASIKIKHIEFDDETPLNVFKYIRKETKKLTGNGKSVNFIFKNLQKSDNRVTLSLDNVPLIYVIKSVCAVAGLTFKVDDYAVIIEPAGSKQKK